MDAAEYALMDTEEERMWWYRALHARLIDSLAGVAGRVLDAGCGTGGLLARLARQRPDLALTAVEWNAQAARRARDKSGAQVARGDVASLPFASGVFDAAVSADVLCHRAVEPAAALHELFRVLRPGGLLTVNMPAFDWLLSAHDRRVHNARRMTSGQVRAMLQQAGFRDVTARYWNGLLLPLMVVQRKLLARGEASSDVAAYPPLLDAALYRMTEIERRTRLPLPAGGSVLAAAVRP